MQGQEDVDTVSVFGHAVFLNAIAFACAYWILLSEADRQNLMDIDLGEAEAPGASTDRGALEVFGTTLHGVRVHLRRQF